MTPQHIVDSFRIFFYFLLYWALAALLIDALISSAS